MARKLAFINQKGGVGKTTLTANCGAFWARRGHRVLAIDLDPQAHLSLHLGVEERGVDDPNSLYHVLHGDAALADARVPVEGEEGLDLVPSTRHLASAEHELNNEVGREGLLKGALERLLAEEPYDLVIIDCPPSLGLLSINALCAVDEVVIPVQAEFFALQGIAQLLDILERVQKRIHPGLKWRVFVPTLVDRRTSFGREVIANLREHFPGSVTESWIPKRVKIAEAPSYGQSIFGYAPDSPGASDFEQLARELESRLEFPAPHRPARAPEARLPEEKVSENGSRLPAETTESTVATPAAPSPEAAPEERVEPKAVDSNRIDSNRIDTQSAEPQRDEPRAS